ILRFSKKPQRFPSTFSSHAAVLHSTERSAKVANQPAVNPDDSAVDLRSNTIGARDVLRPDHCRETVAGRICECNCFLFCIERMQCHNGSEYFFPARLAAGTNSFDDGRLHEEAIGASSFALVHTS